jgi:hypothetical protein
MIANTLPLCWCVTSRMRSDKTSFLRSPSLSGFGSGASGFVASPATACS